jgi:hypothetical protein
LSKLFNLSFIPLFADWFLIPPSIDNGSESLPINTGINPDSAIKSDSLSSASQ